VKIGFFFSYASLLRLSLNIVIYNRTAAGKMSTLEHNHDLGGVNESQAKIVLRIRSCIDPCIAGSRAVVLKPVEQFA